MNNSLVNRSTALKILGASFFILLVSYVIFQNSTYYNPRTIEDIKVENKGDKTYYFLNIREHFSKDTVYKEETIIKPYAEQSQYGIGDTLYYSKNMWLLSISIVLLIIGLCLLFVSIIYFSHI